MIIPCGINDQVSLCIKPKLKIMSIQNYNNFKRFTTVIK